MTKKIVPTFEIDACDACPYHRQFMGDGPSYCDLTKGDIKDVTKIPDFCPLADVPTDD